TDPLLAGKAATTSKYSPPHNPGSPDITVDPALVANPVGQSGLPEQLIELSPTPFWNAHAYPDDPFFDVRRFTAFSRRSDTDRPKERVGQFERVGFRDVETIEQPVPDEIKIRRHGGPCFSFK